MCAELNHKVLRKDTAYDVLRDCQRDGRDFQRNYLQKMIGAVVMTPYNNKTYRVDDVRFDMSPNSKFPTKDGGETDFCTYYKRYNCNIADVSVNFNS